MVDVVVVVVVVIVVVVVVEVVGFLDILERRCLILGDLGTGLAVVVVVVVLVFFFLLCISMTGSDHGTCLSLHPMVLQYNALVLTLSFFMVCDMTSARKFISVTRRGGDEFNR